MRNIFWLAFLALTISLGSAFATLPSASAAGLGEQCGGIANIKCDKGLFCVHPTGSCGGADIAGKCASIEDACKRVNIVEVCGCDGKTYPRECELWKAGVQKKKDGKC